MALIFFRNWKLFDGLQIYPEKFLRRTSKIDRCADMARKARKEDAQDARAQRWVRHEGAKARKSRGCANHVSRKAHKARRRVSHVI